MCILIYRINQLAALVNYRKVDTAHWLFAVAEVAWCDWARVAVLKPTARCPWRTLIRMLYLSPFSNDAEYAATPPPRNLRTGSIQKTSIRKRNPLCLYRQVTSHRFLFQIKKTKMRTLKTSKDRDAFRLDHHEKMKVRAAEKGITLPNSPPNRRSVPRTNADRGVDPNSGMGTSQGSPAGGGKGSNR